MATQRKEPAAPVEPEATPPDGPLTEAVRAALTEHLDEPTARLALTYAAQLDEATHVPLGLAKALRLIEATVTTAVESDPLAYAGAPDAYDKIAAAVSSVTVTSDLGPKLLAALDALLLTPKAHAAATKGLPDPSKPANPLQGLRNSEDELSERRDRRAAR